MICSLLLSQDTKKFSKRKFVLSRSSNGPLYIWTQVPQTTFVGRRWGGARENRGGCAGVVQEAGQKREREAGEITQCLIFRNRKRAKEGKPEKKGWKPGMHGHGRQEFLTPVPPSPPPPTRFPPRWTMDSISNFESAQVCFGGRILTQFLAHLCNREVKSLSYIVMSW